jgi:hypothetical protein
VDVDLSRVWFETFILYDFLDGRAKSLFVRILGHLATAAYHLLTSLNPN